MSFELKILVLTTTLMSFSLTAIADVLVQPGYSKVDAQPSPNHPQSFTTPRQEQRGSEFGPTRAELVPIYANEHQGGVSYQLGRPLLHYPHHPYYPHYPHYPHYAHYPQYIHGWPRYAAQRHPRILKVGGRKVYQPSWFVGHSAVPLAVHHRYKKSIVEQPDFEESGEIIPHSQDSSLDKLSPIEVKIEDKLIDDSQSKNDRIVKPTLFGLDAGHFMKLPESDAKSGASNQRNIDGNNESSIKEPGSDGAKSSSLLRTNESELKTETEKPNLGNFPDPRPDHLDHKSSHKTMPNPMLKNSQEKTVETTGKNLNPGMNEAKDTILGMKSIQQEYPRSSCYNYYQPPLYGNYVPLTSLYQPVYVVRHCGNNDGASKTYSYQQWASQEQIHQTGATEATQFLKSPSYNYVSSYPLGYPQTYVSSLYSNPYVQFSYSTI